MLGYLLAAVCTVQGTIPPDGGVVSGVTSGTSVLSGTCATSNGSPEHVWMWTAPRSGTVTAETCSTTMTLDSVIHVHATDCNGFEIICNDDTTGCANDQRTYRGSRVSWAAIAGQTFAIVVDGYDATQPAGAYALTLSVPPACATDDAYTTTPVLSWDLPTGNYAGLRIYWRRPGEQFTRAQSWDEACFIDEDNVQHCRGGNYGTPAQRFLDIEFEQLEFAVKTYIDTDIESANFSNIVTICMPDIWRVGIEPYPEP